MGVTLNNSFPWKPIFTMFGFLIYPRKIWHGWGSYEIIRNYPVVFLYYHNRWGTYETQNLWNILKTRSHKPQPFALSFYTRPSSNSKNEGNNMKVCDLRLVITPSHCTCFINIDLQSIIRRKRKHVILCMKL